MAAEQNNKTDIKLKVMEALQEEAYKGIVRIDSQTMRDIGVRPGDIVEIEGNKKTVGIVDRAYPTDVGQAVIRMDGILRRNAKTSLGEYIAVRRAEVKEAKTITIAPAQKGVTIQGDPIYFKRGLIGRAVVKGDQIALGGGRRRKRAMEGGPFEDIFDMLEPDMGIFGFSGLKFIVLNSEPKQPVIITENTEVILNPKSVDVLEEKIVDVTYEDIGGLTEEVKKIREMVELPLKHPELFTKLGIDPPKGVLLHGAPGTGKTLLAKAVANETNAYFIHLDAPSTMSKYVGEAEKKIRDIFEQAEKNAPSIIFIDEIDAIATKREESYGEVEKRVVAQLLSVMDGLKSRGKVIVIAATNRPNSIDAALRRPGRFDREIEIGVPKYEGRLQIVKVHTRNMPLDFPVHPEALTKNVNEKYDLIEQKNETRLESLQNDLTFSKNRLESLIAERDYTKKKINSLNDSLNEFEKTNHSEALSESIIRKIKGIRSDMETFKIKISSLNSEHDILNKNIENINIEINNLENVIPKFEQIIVKHSKEKTKVNGMLNDLSLIYNQSKDTKFDEVKNIWLNKYESLERQICNELIEYNILDLELMAKSKKDSELKYLEEIARITHGFVGADIESLCKEAAMSVLRRLLPDLKYEKDGPVPQEFLEKLQIGMNDFTDALKVVRPSALREVFIERPNIKWLDIGGLEQVKQEIKEAVEWPLKYPGIFKNLGVRAPKGILLYGPPGTGKTLLAKAVANESEANFILVNGPELLSKWVGESERGVRKIFEKARQASPCIIFFDEIDAIASRRGRNGDAGVTERMVNQLLTEIDGLQELNDVIIVGATNRPDIVDPALLRPGRFDRVILVPVPEDKSRLQILNIHTKGMPIAKDVDLNVLAEKTESYVGADLESVCREAAIVALREDMKTKEIKMKHFEEALKKVKPSITAEDVKRYEEIEDEYLRTARGSAIREKEHLSYMG